MGHSAPAGSAPPLPPGPQRARTVKSPHPDHSRSHLHPAGRSTMTAGRLGPLVAPLFLGLVLLSFHLSTGAWSRRRFAWRARQGTPGGSRAGEVRFPGWKWGNSGRLKLGGPWCMRW